MQCVEGRGFGKWCWWNICNLNWSTKAAAQTTTLSSTFAYTCYNAQNISTYDSYLRTRGILDSQLSKLPETNIRVPRPPHRKTVGSLRTFISIPECTDRVCNPIDFDSHWTNNNKTWKHITEWQTINNSLVHNHHHYSACTISVRSSACYQ